MQAIRLSWQPWEGFFNAFCLLLACHSPASVKPVLSHPNSSSRRRSFRALQLSEGGWLFLLNCSSLPFFPLFFFFFPSRSCCQRCFSGKFPAGLHDGLGRVLQTAGCLLRADTRAGSGPQPGLYSCSLNPAAAPLGELGGVLGSCGKARRYFVAEELKNCSLLSIATVVLPQHQSLICLDRVVFFGGG